jgi:hypothetical protein
LTAVAYSTLFPVYWEYGEVNYTGEGRTYNVTYLVLVMIVVCMAGLISSVFERLATRLQERQVALGRIDLAFAVAFAFCWSHLHRRAKSLTL